MNSRDCVTCQPRRTAAIHVSNFSSFDGATLEDPKPELPSSFQELFLRCKILRNTETCYQQLKRDFAAKFKRNMEVNPYENAEGNSRSKNIVSEDVGLGTAITENPTKQSDPSAAIGKVNRFRNHEVSTSRDTLGEINMEVPITPDDIMQAGGYGATDDISSILPIASDSTDFEDHPSRVEEYEDLEDDRSGGRSDTLESSVGFTKANVGGTQNAKGCEGPTSKDAFEAVNMEASVTSDEMIRAGGFGATDDINSFLPVASDFTDFEAHLRDARDYEDRGKEVDRPGLGWSRETR